MRNFFQQLIQQFREIWGRFNRLQKILVIAIPSALLVGLLVFILFASRSRYEVLYSRLEQKDAAEIAIELKKSNIPYRLATQEKRVMILVPSDKVRDVRLTLAGEGLPRGKAGYDLFNTPKWGETDFTQKVKYKQAQEGELEKTIESLQQIQSARVSIVIPEPELFTEKEKPTTASVVLELKPEVQLKREQVRGIVHLVTNSVEGLQPENVNVIDSKGNILSAFIQEEQQDNNPNPLTGGSTLTQQAKLTLHQMEIQQSYEKDLEHKVTTMLNKVLGGSSRFAVSVSAELNFDKTEQDSETFEPVVDGQGIARSEQSEREQYVGDGGFPASLVGGVPGTDSNIPGYQAVAGANSQYSKEKITKNYEINRAVKHVVVAPGSPRRVSVGVFVDNLQPQQVESIKSAVVAAAGMDLNRGDQVAVENMPFDNTQALASLKEMRMEMQQNFYMTLGKIGLLVLMAFGVLLFLRSLLKPKKEKKYVEAVDDMELETPMIPQVEDIITTDVTAEDLARAESARAAKKREAVRKEVFEMANRNPENVAQIIKKWLSEE